MPEELSRWDIVLVIATLVTLFGMVIGWVSCLTKPMHALSKTTIQLVKCAEYLQRQLEQHAKQDEKNNEDLWRTVDKHGDLLQKHDTDIAILQRYNSKKE